MKVFTFHLLNDYSGSPKVLSQLINGWIRHDIKVTVVTSSGDKGFLSDLKGVNYFPMGYTFKANPIIRLFHLLLSQILLVIRLYSKVKKEDIIYINTVLPFGAAILGKLKGCTIVYHIHETSVKPRILKHWLFGFVNHFAHHKIYVSQFLADQETRGKGINHILPNAIDQSFLDKAKQNRSKKPNGRNVLMACSLKSYKGVLEFVSQARRLPKYRFKLVLNAQPLDINTFFKETNLPTNLEIFPVQSDLHPFYEWADMVLNLSHTDRWIETFGLTIIEAMSYGLPTIVPPVGGPAEIIEDGLNGFLVNSKDENQLTRRIKDLGENRFIYRNISDNALRSIDKYQEEKFIIKNLRILSRA